MSRLSDVAQSPFLLNGVIKAPLPTAFNRWLEKLVEKTLGLSTLDRLYRQLPASRNQFEFLQRVLDLFNIRYRVNLSSNMTIPATGGVVVVANHPFGGLDGVILAHHLLQQRSDVKFMANYMLDRVPELKDLFISVDPFGNNDATKTNSRPLREALRWLKDGGVLVIFPAGEVSHLHASARQVTDSSWSPSVARLIRGVNLPVIPVCFEGSNSMSFQLAGLMNAKLRTVLLPREFLNKEKRFIELTVGKAIQAKRLTSFKCDIELIRYLRLQTYSLYGVRQMERHSRKSFETSDLYPIVPAQNPVEILADIESLPDEQWLVDSGDFCVVYARSEQIPAALREIGRLREITFRATGEGTGNETDLDVFDDYYLHLLLWDKKKQQIAGAYRLGLVDDIMRKYGKRGLYTQQLFKYRSQLLKDIGPAIELGRSFICAEYQRSYSSLLLLWKGIGAFISRHSKYRVLFGPVSISSDYQTSSRQLLVDFLRSNCFDTQLAKLVKPKKPFRRLADRRWTASDAASIQDLDKISEVIAQIESDDKGIPILLRQYLKLGGRILGFNVDRDFNNALDGLIMVDLCSTDVRILQKYMGKAEARRFLTFHRELMPEWREVS